MRDLKEESKQVQIFYTFVASYDTLYTTVREMASSGQQADYDRAEAICNFLKTIIGGVDDLQVIIDHIKGLSIMTKLEPLRDHLIMQMQAQEEGLLEELSHKYQSLQAVLSIGGDLGPSEKQEMNAEGHDLKSFTKNPIIKEDPGLPITSYDLVILNEIASATITRPTSLSDYAKRFKQPDVRNAIKKLYHEAAYYFEQAFSNTDVNVQVLLLDLVNEDKKGDPSNKKKAEVIDALKDLHILATIDTTANKMTSIVSNHQAFELFLGVLTKNDNDFIIKKLISDPVIMATLFNVSTRERDSNYGFRRMFTMAKHPYDGLILDKFKEVKSLDYKALQVVIDDLSKDKMFKAAYVNYQKSEKTIQVIKKIDELTASLGSSTIDDDTIYGLCYVLDEFTHIDTYNVDLLSPSRVMTSIELIYKFIIQNKAFGRYQLLEDGLEKFYNYRINNVLHSTRLKYISFGGDNIFGITHLDIWYDFHKMAHDYGFENISRVFLTFDHDQVYWFDMNQRVELLIEPIEACDPKKLKLGQYRFNCANSESKGFEHYIFNLYGRIAKQFMSEAIQTTLSSVKSLTFRKVETPGLSSKDDKALRKAMIDYLTLEFLWHKDPELHLHVYKIRAMAILKAITSMETSGKALKPYVKVTLNHYLLSLFDQPSTVAKLRRDLDKFVRGGRDQLFIDHAQAFFKLASRSSQ